MTAEELLREARDRGATFQVLDFSRLRVQAPSPLPENLMAELRQHKPAILSLLANETATDAPAGANQDNTPHLLAWAAQAAETGLTLPEPVQFLESPLRPSTTAEVGRFCRDQLKYLTLARTNLAHGGWGRFTPEWWTKMESNSLEALAALKTATEATHREGGSPE